MRELTPEEFEKYNERALKIEESDEVVRDERMSEERGQNMEKGWKSPSEMVNIELLEVYSHYNRIYLRSPEEQDYISLLRREMLSRMEKE